MAEASPLARVVIAISAYRSDVSVLRLLEQVFAGGGADAAAVLVVDSENSGELARELGSRGWPVEYENSPVNLGSAGNLARRLELAAAHDADWCFAINHDGMFDRAMVQQLVEAAGDGTRVGAVFPRRLLISRGNTLLRPHRFIFEMPSFASPATILDVRSVAWDSSNGALYALEPIRDDILPWADLWMGWEDLAYGWQLQSRGWTQLYCPHAEFLDDYEYEQVRLLGRRLFITRKPPWYGYYQVRNLMIIVRRTGGSLRGWLFLLHRLVRELAFALLFRSEKAKRLELLWMGLVDGLKGVTGRGRGR